MQRTGIKMGEVSWEVNLGQPGYNSIQEFNFNNGVWSFGYAAGLNYAFYRSYDSASTAVDFSETGLQKLTLGLEMYGGVGDSEKGITLDGNKTKQYAGVNLRADFKNEFHIGVGGAFGLTSPSEDAIVRFTAGYEFE